MRHSAAQIRRVSEPAAFEQVERIVALRAYPFELILWHVLGAIRKPHLETTNPAAGAGPVGDDPDSARIVL